MDDQLFETFMSKFASLEKRFDVLDEKVDKVNNWRLYMMGAVGFAGVLLGYAVEIWSNRGG